MIIRSKNSMELTRNGKHCVILGDVENIRDEYIQKMADWAVCMWDYGKIKMWKKSDSAVPGYFIRESQEGNYKVHILDNDQKADLFGGKHKDSPPVLENWEKRELLAYVDWFVE